MNCKKTIFVILCSVVTCALLWSCAGPKPAVKEEEPVAEKKVEKKEVAKVVEPEVKFEPIEWTTKVMDAEVKMGGTPVYVPEEYEKYALTLRSLEDNKFELYLEERGRSPKLMLKGSSTLKPDREGKIAFHITDIVEENVQPVFDVLGLRVLKKDELRDNYYLYGSLKKRGASLLEAYDMNSSVVMEFRTK
jgi:hypothetical protein